MGGLASRCARHGNELEDESSLLAQRGEQLAEGKGVHREVESEGSWKQNAALMNKNRIRRIVEDKWAYDYEIQYPYRQATDVDSAGISGKVYCLTRGDLDASHYPWA